MFLFFSIIDLYVLVTLVIGKSFMPTAELAAPTGVPTKGEKTKMETHPVTVEAKIIEWSV